jgi:SEFIR domain
MAFASPKVFISYSHDNPEHSERIRVRALTLADDLNPDKFEVMLDQYVNDPDERWPAWCERQICEADRVLVAITATYRRRYDGAEPPGKGYGAAFEATIIRQQLYEAGHKNSKYRAIVFSEGDEQLVPEILRGNNVYRVTDHGCYQQLLVWVRGSTRSLAAGTRPSPIAWPEAVEDFLPRLADRKPEFCHFKQVLAGKTPERILLLRGPSNSGKTALLQVLRSYCQQVGIAASYVELKGCPPLEDVFQAIELDLPRDLLPAFRAASGPSRAFKILYDLQLLREPMVLAFDTYERSSDMFRKWVEDQLLPRL